MTKLWIMSDLHMETIPHPEKFDPKRPDFDVLVVAGDVWETDYIRGFRLLRRLAGDKPIIFVMGNHEPWNGILSEEIITARIMARECGITFLEGETALVEGCLFVGTTLWTDYLLARGVYPEAVTGEQIDIEHDGGTHLITVGDVTGLHATARMKLRRLLLEADKMHPIVVVTHHAPHPLCVIPEECRDTWRAGNMASDLSHLTDAGLAKLWVHGHVHASIDIERPGGTRIVCNPAGSGFENTDFDEGLVIEV